MENNKFKIAIIEDNNVLSVFLKEAIESHYNKEVICDIYNNYNDFRKNCNIYKYDFFIIDIILSDKIETGIDCVNLIKCIKKRYFGIYLTGCIENTNYYFRATLDIQKGYIFEIILKTDDIKSILQKIIYYINLIKNNKNG